MNNLPCPQCRQTSAVIKIGFSSNGSQRYRCKRCNRSFTPRTSHLSQRQTAPLLNRDGNRVPTETPPPVVPRLLDLGSDIPQNPNVKSQPSLQTLSTVGYRPTAVPPRPAPIHVPPAAPRRVTQHRPGRDISWSVTGVLLSLLAIVTGLMYWVYGAGAVQTIAEPLLQILKSLNGWQSISIGLSIILLLVLNFQIIFRQTPDNEGSVFRALAKMLIIFALEGALIQVMYNVAHEARPLVQVAAYVKFDNAETLGILINITMLIMLNVLVVSWHVGEGINSFWGAIMKYPLVDFMLLGMIYGSIHAITWIIRAPVNLESFLPIIVAVLSATVSAAILAKLADFNKLSNGSRRETGEVSFLAGCAYWLVAVALLLFIFRLIQGFS